MQLVNLSCELLVRFPRFTLLRNVISDVTSKFSFFLFFSLETIKPSTILDLMKKKAYNFSFFKFFFGGMKLNKK